MLESVQVGLGLLLLMVIIGGVPLLILFGYDRAASRFDDAVLELRARRHDDPLEHRRNVRALKRPHGEPIERLGCDLRRLRQQIQHSEHCSATQYAALRQAYDKVLSETCAMLELSHELDLPTMGTERDIERVRVEAMLEGHGIVLSLGRRQTL